MRLPAEVVVFLESMEAVRDLQLGINPLSPEESARLSAKLQAIPVAVDLGLIWLDDANDSNLYCFMSKGPAAGMILHFSHDPEPEIEFSDLDSFGEALRSAIENNLQAALIAFLRSWLARDDDEADFYICLFLPLLHPLQLDVLRQAAAHPSFFV
jgi:hypothetical protein